MAPNYDASEQGCALTEETRWISFSMPLGTSVRLSRTTVPGFRASRFCHTARKNETNATTPIYISEVSWDPAFRLRPSLQMCQRTAALRFRLKHRPQEDGRLFRIAH